MTVLKKIALTSAAFAIIGVTAVEAAPLAVAPPSALGLDKVTAGTPVETVAYRRYYHGRYYGGRYYGRRYYNPAGAAVAGAALGLVGAGIAAATAPSYGYGYGYPAYGYYPSYGYPYGGYYGW